LTKIHALIVESVAAAQRLIALQRESAMLDRY
jgi:hypothetical protein